MNEPKSHLALALSKAQGKLKGAKKDTTNPFFKSKYADLSSVWEACRSALAENELAVIQSPMMVDGFLMLKTKLIHSSGEFEESFMPISAPITAKAQEMGSAITYARRYSLAAIVGVAPDDDDDGNTAQTTQPAKITPKENPTDIAKAFAAEISLADTNDKLDALVKRQAVFMAKLSTELPAWHKKLSDLIDAQRASFGG